MTALELLHELRTQDVELWCEGTRLRFRAPKGTLSAEQKAALASAREAVVAALRTEAKNSVRSLSPSFNQKSLWFVHQQAPQSRAYNIGASMRVLSPLDTAALAQAVQALSDRHSTLRTTYGLDAEGALRQRIVGATDAVLDVHAVPGITDEALRASAEADFFRPFDLERGPLFRAALYSRNAEDHVLLLAVHHIAADGWSLMILVEELFKLYGEAASGMPAALPRPPLEYADHVAAHEELLAGPEGERLWAYWREKLSAPRAQLELPTDRPRPAVSSFEGASVPFSLSRELTEAMKRAALELSATPFVVLLAAFQTFLFRLTGVKDVIVGTPMFGRGNADLMRVVGDFVNSIPLRSKLGEETSFRALVAQLKTTVVEALDAQAFPLPLLVQRLQPERDSSRSPLFDTFFMLQLNQFRDLQRVMAGDLDAPPFELGGVRVAPFPMVLQEGQFDLGFQAVERDGSLQCTLTYCTDLFEASTIRSFAKDYVAILDAVTKDPSIPLGQLVKPEGSATKESAKDFVERLRGADIRLFLENDKLRLNAPKGAVTDELKAAIAARRDELIETLKAQGASAPRHTKVKRPVRIPRDQPLPVSSAQQRLWFLDRMAPGTPHYNVGGSVRLRGRLDAAIFSRTLDALVARHESLRTHIGERDGAPDVIIERSARADFEYEDVSHLPLDEAEAEALRRSTERVALPFDVARGPLMRAYVVRAAPDAHYVTVCVHHIVSDGWSMMIAFREIGEIYDRISAGRSPELPPLPLDYVDYAAWEAEHLHSGRMARELSHWKKVLAGAPAVLELPTDRPRGAAPTMRGHRMRRFLDMRVIDALKQVSRQHEVTLYMTLLAAFQLLLHRYSGQADLVVGSPVANRNLPEFEGIIGCFVNNVVLRSQVTATTTFAEMLQAAKQTTLSAFEHRDLPFDVLVDGLRPDRTSNHAPIFQVLFALQSFLTEVPAPAGLKIETLDAADIGVSRFDLSVELSEYEGKFAAVYEFSSELFDFGTIERLHGHFARLLGAIARDTATPIASLPLLSDEDDRLILDKWNDTAAEHDRTRALHALVEARAKALPDAIAVIAGEASLTYRMLDERANQLAHLLSERGVAPGTLVAICLDRTVDIPVALAAVLKAGAAYVPLDPAHPAERLRYTLGDAGVACAITLRRFASLLEGADAPLIVLDEVGAALASQPTTPLGVQVSAADRAYVIYTSGSTGKPKGVEVEHRNVVSFLEGMRKTPGFAPQDRLLAVTTLSFDIAGLEFWLPLSTGATLVVASRTDVLEGERLAAMLEEQRISVLQATPATFRLLLETGWAGKPGLKVLCGGEALPKDLAAQLVSRVGELWNVYGPTETTIWSTVCRIEDADAPVTIGRPIHNTRLYILEPSGLPAPIGVPGELCIAGEGVARGYHDRPELTAEKFVTIMLPDGRAERVYRTGDVARYRSDGRVDFLGRRDHQVKVRGYRIELGEIESVLATHPGVKECVAGVREDTPGDQRLVGYVVTSGGAAFDADAARATLRGKLPEYMVPNLFMALPALPLTPNGKIDRKALPAPEAAIVAPTAEAEALMTPIQRRVAGAWREVLHVDRVGLYDNFFDIGGHSLLLVKLHAALKREFSSDLRLVELFQWTNVAAQAARLSSGAPSDAAIQRAHSRAERLVDG